MDKYLLRHIDKPLAWGLVFSAAGLVGGASGGLRGELPGGGVTGALLVGFAGGAVGLLIGALVWLVARLTGFLDRPVRSDRWGHPLRCAACAWRSHPEGWRLREVLACPERCPECSEDLVPLVPDCPRCKANPLSGRSVLKDMLALVRPARNLEQALWGHYTCRQCGCGFDKWGREWPAGPGEGTGS